MAHPPARFQEAIDRLTSGTTRFEIVYCSRSAWAQSHISVLDSSFNPPTLAHWALASTSPSPSLLLLLSISNADKKTKPDDVAPAQRLQMMVELADELAGCDDRGVAVAALNEPIFVKKSTLLLENLSGASTGSKPELTFQMGWDTIVRVFAPRYYPSPDSMLASFSHFFGPEGSRILCARRPPAPSSSSPASTTIPTDSLTDGESEFLSSPHVAPFYKEHKIKLVDLDPAAHGISSSGVRSGTIETAEKWCSKGIVKYIREHRLYFWN